MEFRNQILVGDVLDRLRELPDESVHMVVTSPPYWGLRDYGTGTWDGGDPSCQHKRANVRPDHSGGDLTGRGSQDAASSATTPYKGVCGACGATRVDLQIGLERTPDDYVAKMVEVFREVRRVLRDDGTLWLNIGDSYISGSVPGSREGSTLQGSTEGQDESKKVMGGAGAGQRIGHRSSFRRDRMERQDEPHRGALGLKPKDLVMMPHRLALALQADGWWVRMDNVWSKPNPMPESITDRPTKSHEYVFLLSKSERYFYDAEAIREPMTESSMERISQPNLDHQSGGVKAMSASRHRNARTTMLNMKKKLLEGSHGTAGGEGTGMRMHEKWSNPLGRNKRSVWVIPTQAYPEAHFATFPQKLVEPCILAGTSEGGCCSRCGTPYRREVKVEYENPGNRSTNGDRSQDRKHLEHGSAGYAVRLERRSTTTGWKKSCDCSDWFNTSPAVVLDPFMGSGTTALVALRARRDFVGIELNPAYAELARKRIDPELSQLKLC